MIWIDCFEGSKKLTHVRPERYPSQALDGMGFSHLAGNRVCILLSALVGKGGTGL